MAGLYRGPIIDAHIHLWDLAMDRHPWLRPTGGAIQALGNLAPIRRNYLVEDYRRDAANQNVVASVYIEAAWDRADDPLVEIEWLETLDKSSGVAARCIGFADLTAPDAAAMLDRLSEIKRCVGVRQMLSWHPTQPARSFARRPNIADEADFRRGVAARCIGFADLTAPGAAAMLDRMSELNRCVGVRQMLSWHPTQPARSFARRPNIADEADFRRGVALLARHDQLLEFMLYPYQVEEVARLANDFPNQTFIVNHCGSPIDRDPDGMLRWKEGLRRLSSTPNVLIKISALTAYDPSPTPESLRAVALHCIECFGVDRSMFGSDFPVGRLWTSFDAIFDGFKAIVSDFSEAEQAALFHDNARRVYRMDAL